MPTPIIELQRRLTIAGEIRVGGEKTDSRRPGPRLRSFRLTSAHRPLIEQAATLYGGDVSAWESPNGQKWQVYTKTSELPVLVMPSFSLAQSYELWEGATQQLRVCDGFFELKSGEACACAREGVDRCDLYTRLIVALPELETAQGWILRTRGANAAHELPTMMRLVETIGSGQSFVSARLRLDERRGVKDGQVVRYVVPSLDLASGYAALAGGTQRQLSRASEPPPAVPEAPVAVETSLALETSLGNVSAPRAGKSDEYGPPAPAPAPIPAPGAALPAHEQTLLDDAKEQLQAVDVTAESTSASSAAKPTAAQKKKLNVLVGKLRDGGHIDTDSLYESIATRLRHVGKRDLVMSLDDSIDSDGVLHWSPLREALTREEASTLIDWLEKKQQRVAEGAVS